MPSFCCYNLGQTRTSKITAVLFWTYIVGMIVMLVYQIYIGGFIFAVDARRVQFPDGGGEALETVGLIGGVFALLGIAPNLLLLGCSCVLFRIMSNMLQQHTALQVRELTGEERAMHRHGSVQQWIHVSYTIGWYVYILSSIVINSRLPAPFAFKLLTTVLGFALWVQLIVQFVYFWIAWSAFSKYLDLDASAPAPFVVSTLGYERIDA